jgi:hypothetical protein
MRNLVLGGLLSIGLALSSGAPASAQGAAVSELMQEKAVVESIDHATRTVLLREEDGSLTTVKVGPGVRNLPQVKAGDQIVAQVRLGVLAAMAPPDGSGGPVARADVDGRAPEGARPGAYAADAMRVRVTFSSYDPKTKIVNFTLPSGEAEKETLQTKTMQDFAAGLKAGDKVDVTFARSVAVAVLPAK